MSKHYNFVAAMMFVHAKGMLVTTEPSFSTAKKPPCCHIEQVFTFFGKMSVSVQVCQKKAKWR